LRQGAKEDEWDSIGGEDSFILKIVRKQFGGRRNVDCKGLGWLGQKGRESY